MHTQYTYIIYIHNIHTHKIHTQYAYTIYIHNIHTQYTYTHSHTHIHIQCTGNVNKYQKKGVM